VLGFVSQLNSKPRIDTGQFRQAQNRGHQPQRRSDATQYYGHGSVELTTQQVTELKNNVANTFNITLEILKDLAYTQPYWLKEKGTVGMYRVDEQKNIGIPDVIREVKVTFNIGINGVTIPYERDVVYKYNDDVKGEVYKPFDIVPDVTTSIIEKVTIFNNEKSKNRWRESALWQR
jgi:hypothetical protein